MKQGSLVYLPNELLLNIVTYLDHDSYDALAKAYQLAGRNPLADPYFLYHRFKDCYSGIPYIAFSQHYKPRSLYEVINKKIRDLQYKLKKFTENLYKLAYFFGNISAETAKKLLLDPQENGYQYKSGTRFLRFDAEQNLFYDCQLFPKRSSLLTEAIIQASIENKQDQVNPEAENLSICIKPNFTPDRINLRITDQFTIDQEANTEITLPKPIQDVFLVQWPLKLRETKHQLKLERYCSDFDDPPQALEETCLYALNKDSFGKYYLKRCSQNI